MKQQIHKLMKQEMKKNKDKMFRELKAGMNEFLKSEFKGLDAFVEVKGKKEV